MSETEYVGPVDLPERNFEMPEGFNEDPFIRVYLASALTGREEHKDEDDRIRLVITEVLEKSRYNGLRYKVYNPEKFTGIDIPLSSEEVYRIDFEKVVEADLVVFYLNAPSWGVGYEGQIAAGATVPKILVYPKLQKVSRMVFGDFNPVLFAVEFESQADLAPRLSHELHVFGKEIVEMSSEKRRVFNSQTTTGLAKFIFGRRVRLGKSIDLIARETGIAGHWITKVQLDGRKSAMLTWIQLQRVAKSLEAELGSKEDGVIYMREREKYHIEQPMKKSLENLYEAYVSWRKIVDDEVLLSLWGEYSDHFKNSNSTLWKLDKPISKKEWLQKFEECEKVRIMQILNVTPNKLPDIQKKSLDSLYHFSTVGNPVSDKTLCTLWTTFKKDIRKHIAARKKIGQAKQTAYSIEDWRKKFNKLHWDD